jgi:hypothetical protein
VFREFEDIEHALELWREQRGYEAVGCGAAERQAFTAGWQMAIRTVDQVAQARYLVPHDG